MLKIQAWKPSCYFIISLSFLTCFLVLKNSIQNKAAGSSSTYPRGCQTSPSSQHTRCCAAPSWRLRPDAARKPPDQHPGKREPCQQWLRPTPKRRSSDTRLFKRFNRTDAPLVSKERIFSSWQSTVLMLHAPIKTEYNWLLTELRWGRRTLALILKNWFKYGLHHTPKYRRVSDAAAQLTVRWGFALGGCQCKWPIHDNIFYKLKPRGNQWEDRIQPNNFLPLILNNYKF